MKILPLIRMKLAKPFQGQHFHAEGASVALAGKIVTKTLGTFILTLPDPVSLNLNDAQGFIDKALKLKERLLKTKNATVSSKKYTPEELQAMGAKSVADVLKIDPDAEVVRDIDTEKLYTYIQSSADALTCLMTAVESFVNIAIPKDQKEKITRGGKEVELDKIGIVRWTNVETKLGIVGRVKGKEDFKGKAHWESFLKVKELRDEFIHFKQADAKIDAIWSPMVTGLVDADLQKFYKDIVDLIEYLKPDFFKE